MGMAPLPLGSTGVWKPLAALATKRESPAVTLAPDPVSPGTFYLYALGWPRALNAVVVVAFSVAGLAAPS